jgi:hypothetical protein
VAYTQKILDPPDGVMNSWDILKTLAEQAGFRHTFQTWDDLSGKAEKAFKGRSQKG